MNRRGPLLLALVLAACAPPTPPAAPPAPISAPIPAAPPSSASSRLLALVPPAATAVIQIDWKAARASPLYATLLAEGSKLGLFDPRRPHCVVLPDAVDAVVIAFAGTERASAFLALQSHDESVVRECMPELAAKASDVEPPVAGHPAVPIVGGRIAVAVRGLFVIGNRPDVERALASDQRAAPVAPINGGFDLPAGAVLSLHREGPGFFGDASPVSVVFETDAEHLALRVSGTLASPDRAASLLLQATKKRDEIAAKSAAADDGETRALRRLIAGAHVAADGARLHAEIEVKGGADEQLPFVRLLGGLVLLEGIGGPSTSPELHVP